MAIEFQASLIRPNKVSVCPHCGAGSLIEPAAYCHCCGRPVELAVRLHPEFPGGEVLSAILAEIVTVLQDEGAVFKCMSLWHDQPLEKLCIEGPSQRILLLDGLAERFGITIDEETELLGVVAETIWREPSRRIIDADGWNAELLVSWQQPGAPFSYFALRPLKKGRLFLPVVSNDPAWGIRDDINLALTQCPSIVGFRWSSDGGAKFVRVDGNLEPCPPAEFLSRVREIADYLRMAFGPKSGRCL